MGVERWDCEATHVEKRDLWCRGTLMSGKSDYEIHRDREGDTKVRRQKSSSMFLFSSVHGHFTFSELI